MPNHIRDLRHEKKMTLKQLGEILNVSESTVSNYETGKRQPDNETLLRLGEIFDVSVGYILGVEERKNPDGTVQHTITNDELKRALFGTEHIDDNALDDVKQYAEFVASKQDEDIPELSTA